MRSSLLLSSSAATNLPARFYHYLPDHTFTLVYDPAAHPSWSRSGFTTLTVSAMPDEMYQHGTSWWVFWIIEMNHLFIREKNLENFDDLNRFRPLEYISQGMVLPFFWTAVNTAAEDFPELSYDDGIGYRYARLYETIRDRSDWYDVLASLKHSTLFNTQANYRTNSMACDAAAFLYAKLYDLNNDFFANLVRIAQDTAWHGEEDYLDILVEAVGEDKAVFHNETGQWIPVRDWLENHPQFTAWKDAVPGAFIDIYPLGRVEGALYLRHNGQLTGRIWAYAVIGVNALDPVENGRNPWDRPLDTEFYGNTPVHVQVADERGNIVLSDRTAILPDLDNGGFRTLALPPGVYTVQAQADFRGHVLTDTVTLEVREEGD